MTYSFKQTRSYLGRPDSRYYFRLADHPLSFVAGYSSRTWEFLCLFPVALGIDSWDQVIPSQIRRCRMAIVNPLVKEKAAPEVRETLE